jgi:hypothetical protein
MLANHQVGAQVDDVPAELLQTGTGQRVAMRPGVNQHDE